MIKLPLQLVTSKIIDRKFGRSEDYIEVHIYDQTGRLLTSIPNFTDFGKLGDTNLTNELNLDPVSILNSNGYLNGKYKITFNILRKKIFNTSDKLFTVKEISPTRTELKVVAKNIPNQELKQASRQYINEISNSPFLRDFVLNFGNNKLITGINLIFSEEKSTNELIIKLNGPLPNNIFILDSFSIAEEIANPEIIEQDLGFAKPVDTSISLRPPNFNIDVKTNNSIPSEYKNYDEILEYSLTSSYQQLLNKLENKEIPEIQYDFVRTPTGSNEGEPQEVTYNFENFIHFGSALERLKNFKYKVELLEQYNKKINTINSISGPTSASSLVLNDKESIITKKTNLLKGLDGYERFLYYQSGALSWPKSNSTTPYTLYSVSSSQAKTWLGDERDTYPDYGGQLLTASLYDLQNEYSLIRLIPNHIIENPDNTFYTTFVHMLGHHYDQIWTHIKHITETKDTHHTRGISKDLVYHSLKSLGLNTFDQFENSNLIEYILGEGKEGSIFYDTPISQSLITASNEGSIPKEDITKEIWKRLYHNAPYLLKTKGTERGLKALMSCYGVPSTILNVKEYGGSTTDKSTYKTFSYEKSGLALKGDSGTNGYFIKTKWNSNLTNELSSSAKTIEFRIKPHRSNDNYHLWSLSGSFGSNNAYLNDHHLILQPYTGSTDISSSGDATQYGRLIFSKLNNTETTSTEYFPIYNGNFWNIHIGCDGTNADTANSVNLQFGAYQSNYLKNITSVIANFAINIDKLSRTWGIFAYSNVTPNFLVDQKLGYNSGADYCYIGGLPSGKASNDIDGLRYSGSLQEVRYHFGELLSHNTLTQHALEPFMYSGNTVSSSYNNVVVRLPLGSNNKKDSGSFQPNEDKNYLVDYNVIKNGDFSKGPYTTQFPSAGFIPNWTFTSNTLNDGIIPTLSEGGVRIKTTPGLNENTNIRQDLSNRVTLGRVHQLTYTITETDHDEGLMVEIGPGSNPVLVLPTTLGTHTVEFTLRKEMGNPGTPHLLIKRSYNALSTGVDIVIDDIVLKEKIITSNMSTQTWEEVIETHHLPTPDTIGISMTSEKVRIDEGTIDDNWLSPTIKTETSTLDRQPLDYPDLGVFFSPTTEINEDILYTLGAFRLDDYIGSPLPSVQSSSVYEDLSDIKDIYFKKVKNRYNYWDYVKLIQYIDHTLFKVIEQFVPMKTNLKTGLLIEPHYLERNKFKREIPTTGVGQSMKNNSYQTFEFEIDPEKKLSLTNSSVIVTNNLLQTTGSNNQRLEQGTNGTLNIKDQYKLAGTSNYSGNITKGRISSRYYRRLIDSKEQNY